MFVELTNLECELRTAEPGGLPSMGLHRVGHDRSDLAASAATLLIVSPRTYPFLGYTDFLYLPPPSFSPFCLSSSLPPSLLCFHKYLFNGHDTFGSLLRVRDKMMSQNTEI